MAGYSYQMARTKNIFFGRPVLLVASVVLIGGALGDYYAASALVNAAGLGAAWFAFKDRGQEEPDEMIAIEEADSE